MGAARSTRAPRSGGAARASERRAAGPHRTTRGAERRRGQTGPVSSVGPAADGAIDEAVQVGDEHAGQLGIATGGLGVGGVAGGDDGHALAVRRNCHVGRQHHPGDGRRGLRSFPAFHDGDRGVHDGIARVGAAVAARLRHDLIVQTALMHHGRAAARHLHHAPGHGRREQLPEVRLGRPQRRGDQPLRHLAAGVDGEDLRGSKPTDEEVVPVHDDVTQIAVQLHGPRRRAARRRE